MIKKKYKAILFDLDHTLCDTARADKLGLLDFQVEMAQLLPKNLAFKVGAAYMEIIYGSLQTDIKWQKKANENELDFRSRLLFQTLQSKDESRVSAVDVKKMAQRFMDLRVKNLDYFPGAFELLKKLRPLYTISIVSNGPLFSQQPKVDKLGLVAAVDHIVLGGALMHQKPHPEIFLHACRLSACLPAEALHVGDKLDVDIAGAMAAGVDSVWVCGDNFGVNSQFIPDYVVSSVVELYGCLPVIA